MPNYHSLYSALLPIYGQHEAQSIARMVMLQVFGIDMTGIVMGHDRELSSEDQSRLEIITQRLAKGEPVQYVLGQVSVDGLTFQVDSRVLIPRPETEQLIGLISQSSAEPTSILDVGTGSGLIAICLKKQFPQSHVVAIDVSEDAIEVAQKNARLNNVEIEFRLTDALAMNYSGESFAMIVSNPPYICQKEQADMHRNVMDFEPHEALFVPDHDPLLFYRHIARYAAEALLTDGQLWFEINPAYWRELQAMLHDQGFKNVEAIDDFCNKKRFIHATK